MKVTKKIGVICLLIFFLFITSLKGQNSQQFINGTVKFDSRGLIQLIAPDDKYKADLIPEGSTWGEIDLQYRIEDGDWLSIYTDDRTCSFDTVQGIAIYTDYQEGMPFGMTQKFTVNKKGISWDIELENHCPWPITIGNLAIKLPWKMPYGEELNTIFEKCFTKHHFIQGDGSFIHFTRANGEAPFIGIGVKPGTSLEYFSSGRNSPYKAYIFSGLDGNNEKSGTWRQEHRYGKLDPKGQNGDKMEFGFNISWADSYQALRDNYFRDSLIDIHAIPGMTVSTDIDAKVAIRSLCKIDSVIPEFPSESVIKELESKDKFTSIYELKLKKLGENRITIYFGNGRKTYLEYFVTEPIETLVKKRSSFIVNHQQHRDSAKWYNGLYSVWDMKNKVLRGPDNTDGYDHWWGYVLACDDPALCKAPYVASKNVAFPDSNEIASIEYYIEHFVWGGLQRTDEEKPYPYGIYGTPNWKVCRDSLLRAKVKSHYLNLMNVWRSYDYPHIMMMYYHMYQIASMYPRMVHYLDAKGYLERAWQTAKAYFIYPYEILPWYETYKWGCYNELLIPDLVKELRRHNRNSEADWLINEWEKKVKYFIYDDKYPFRSEYSVDRTAFETSHALAKYAMENELKPDSNLWYDKNLKQWYSHPKIIKEEANNFMKRQLMANLASRGWLESTYYLLGSDFIISSDNHSLTYMARMGGWGILDYAINFAKDPSSYLRLGYASHLSSYALMNTGTPETNYGYWFPGKENDGAIGWAFLEKKHSRVWIKKSEDRGSWRYDGEADLGMGAALRTSATILSNDSLFGWFAYGGVLKVKKKAFEIIPRDEFRRCFYIINDTARTGLRLERDGFKKEKVILVEKNGNEITLNIENRTNDNHFSEFSVWCTSAKEIKVYMDEKPIKVKHKDNHNWVYDLPIKEDEHSFKLEFYY